MDLDSIRAFVVAADEGRFQEAAIELSLTQQAVSKRVEMLEAELGVRLFRRTPSGLQLTLDGQAFLPHARAVLDAVRRATDSVRGRRALRIDIIGRRIAPATLLQNFHRARPGIEIDVVTLSNADSAIRAVHEGTIDATFRTQRVSVPKLPSTVSTMRVLDEPIELLTSSGHELADARWLTPRDLAGHRIWMPGLIPGSEWTAYYTELAETFGLTIEGAGANFGVEHMLDVVSSSPSISTFVGTRTLVPWTTRGDLRRIPLRNPTPIYPHSLMWRPDNSHPGLAALLEHCLGAMPDSGITDVWTPSWA